MASHVSWTEAATLDDHPRRPTDAKKLVTFLDVGEDRFYDQTYMIYQQVENLPNLRVVN